MIDNTFLELSGWEVYHFKDPKTNEEAIFSQNRSRGLTVNRNQILSMYSDLSHVDISALGVTRLGIQNIPPWLLERIISQYENIQA